MRRTVSFRLLGLVLSAVAAHAQTSAAILGEAPQEIARRTVVPADSVWVDTGFVVEQGDLLLFQASGEVSLQKGNPAARCGPAGLDLRTVQQPIPDQNLGALIGKISQLISVKKDEDTGEEIREEIVSLFFIGSGQRVAMPIRGRIYLGINENVVKDNSGEFIVLYMRIPD